MSGVREADASTRSSNPDGRGRVRGVRDRWIYPAIGLLFALVKVHALGLLTRHRFAVAPLAVVWACISILRARPAGLAVSGGILGAAADSGGPVGLALLFGLAIFAMLMTAFLGAATVLRLRQPEWRPRASLVRGER